MSAHVVKFAAVAALACAGWLAHHAHADATRAHATPVEGVTHAVAVVADTSTAALEPTPVREPYSPARRYARAGCVPGRVYWRAGGGPPPDCDSSQWVISDSPNGPDGLRCAAVRAGLAMRGFSAGGRLRQWDPVARQWTLPEPGARGALECEQDRRVHGAAAGPWYAADGGPSPWSTDERAEIAWDEHGTTYTLYDAAFVAWWHGRPRDRSSTWRAAQAAALAALPNADLSVALLRHSWNDDGGADAAAEGGMVLFDVPGAIAAERVARELRDARFGGGAPLAETVDEAFRMFGGAAVRFGRDSHAAPDAPLPSSPSVRTGPAGALYRSPLGSSCSRAHVLLLGAGAPSQDAGVLSGRWPGDAPGACRADVPGHCASSLLGRLLRVDAGPLPGVQSAHVDWWTLAPAPWAGALPGPGPTPVEADALAPTLPAAAARWSSPARAVGAPIRHVAATAAAGEYAYAAAFQPSRDDRWTGGLLRIRPAEDGGAEVVGEASPAPPGERRLYTDVAGAALTAAANVVDAMNARLTDADLGLGSADAAARESSIAWARGVDVDDEDGDGDRAEARTRFGAMLGAPAAVRYADGSTVVYVGSSDGFLHAFADGRREAWAYVPASFLRRIAELRTRTSTGRRHAGLDGDVRALLVDPDGDRRIDASRGERAVLLFGLRRGGRAYFAVDVTDAASPRLLWRLTPRELPGLAQTWAAPVAARLTVAGAAQSAGRYVVLLAGGHDPAQDRRQVRRRDRIGAALYLVDAFTGRLLWRAGGPSSDVGPGGPAPDLYVGTLDYAIAATPRLLDLDGDGELDRAYVADTGGQVFRFEFTSGAAPSSLARAVLLASLGGAAAADRRFYAEPDVVAVRRGRGTPYAAITLGSGFAPDPLAAGVADRLYSLRDVLPDAWRRTPDPAPVTDEQLADVTEGAAAPASRGWKRRLDRPGQRILVPARTIDHAVYVPSWLPPGAGPGVDCVQPEGSNRLHVVDVRDGRPAAFRVIEAPDDDPEAPSLGSGGIAPPLTLVRRRADAGCAGRCPEDMRGLVGGTAVRVPWPGAVVRAGWAERGIE